MQPILIVLLMGGTTYCDALLFMVVVAKVAYAAHIGKSIYEDPRPYMMTTGITPLDCSASYGNPSGHTTLVTAFFAFSHLAFFTGRYRALNRLQYKIAGFFLCYTIIVLTGFSRIILGVHTINQVLYGF